jgi:hypothetical protein
MRKRAIHWGALLGGILAAGALTACGDPDENLYVYSFTDGHGRVCTFAYTVREGTWDSGRDVDVSQIDCVFPEEGSEPGEHSSERLELP